MSKLKNLMRPRREFDGYEFPSLGSDSDTEDDSLGSDNEAKMKLALGWLGLFSEVVKHVPPHPH